MNKNSQYALRTFACELPAPASPDDDAPTPFIFAKMTVDWNNEQNGTTFGLCTGYHQAPDHTWWDIAWVYDTTGITGDGGDVVMCWWQETSCPGCEGHGDYPIFDNRDGVIGHGRCEMTHPTCGKCEACRWTAKHGPYDEATGKLSHPACTGPPPPVSLVKVHYCDDPNHCCPF